MLMVAFVTVALLQDILGHAKPGLRWRLASLKNSAWAR